MSHYSVWKISPIPHIVWSDIVSFEKWSMKIINFETNAFVCCLLLPLLFFFFIVSVVLKASFTANIRRNRKKSWTHFHYIMENKAHSFSSDSFEFQLNMLLNYRTIEREIIPDSYLLAVNRLKTFPMLDNPVITDQVTRNSKAMEVLLCFIWLFLSQTKSLYKFWK